MPRILQSKFTSLAFSLGIGGAFLCDGVSGPDEAICARRSAGRLAWYGLSGSLLAPRGRVGDASRLRRPVASTSVPTTGMDQVIPCPRARVGPQRQHGVQHTEAPT
jgi:hypothetical protein